MNTVLQSIYTYISNISQYIVGNCIIEPCNLSINNVHNVILVHLFTIVCIIILGDKTFTNALHKFSLFSRSTIDFKASSFIAFARYKFQSDTYVCKCVWRPGRLYISRCVIEDRVRHKGTKDHWSSQKVSHKRSCVVSNGVLEERSCGMAEEKK